MSTSELDAGLFQFAVRSEDDVRITVFDGRGKLVAEGVGVVDRKLAPGLYAVRTELAGEIEEEIIRHDRPMAEPRHVQTPTWYSSVPLKGAEPTHEQHVHAAEVWSKKKTCRAPIGRGEPASSRMFLFIRTVSQRDVKDEPLSAGVQVTSPAGEVLCDLARDRENTRWNDKAGWLALTVDVACRSVFLETTAEPRRVLVVHFSPGWDTQCFLLHRGVPHSDTLRVLNVPFGQGFQADSSEARTLDLALSGLQNHRNLLPARVMTDLLNGKIRNPMEGLVGAHFLLRRPDLNHETVDRVLGRLADFMPGSPDLRALEILADRRLNRPTRAEPLELPPMLRAGFDAVIASSIDVPGLVPEGSGLDRIASRVFAGSPWTTWVPLGEPWPGEAMTAAGRPNSVGSLGTKRTSARQEASWVAHSAVARVIDAKRENLSLSLRDVARHISLTPEAVRRALFEALRAGNFLAEIADQFSGSKQDILKGVLRLLIQSPSGEPALPSRRAGGNALISYSSDGPHSERVHRLADRLTSDGVNIKLVDWNAVPVELFPAIFDWAIRKNDFVIASCSAELQERLDQCSRGSGYISDMIALELFGDVNRPKLVPVLWHGPWEQAVPPSLLGYYYIDLAGDLYSESDYNSLLRVLRGHLELPPPVNRWSRPLSRDNRGVDADVMGRHRQELGPAIKERNNDYGTVRINLASPVDIRDWSFGEVKKPETFNYRTYRPERDGLFCERIFGPEKDWECSCGKYRDMKYKGMICDRCGVKVAHSRVRRKRMGHIELAVPVVHIWFFKTMPSRLSNVLGNVLGMKSTSLEKVIYLQDYVVIDPKGTPFNRLQLLTQEEYRVARERYGDGGFEADMGAEAVRKLLVDLDLVQLSVELRKQLSETGLMHSQKELINRLKIVESIRDSGNRPEWMVLECIPVIPPDLRPLVPGDSDEITRSDLNDLYRRIINRNNRLKKLIDLDAPEAILREEKRTLQQSVDALFYNSRCKQPLLSASKRPLMSLTDMIEGKQGRFRENLLGKRVDYSARSVIVVGPYLRLHQCGLPKKIALELFQPFIIRRLKELGHADTIKSAKKMLERKDEKVWDILEEVIRNHPVLLNRAPTLHRMGIQAFEPTLVEGNAIKLHPLVCKGFNADFDGDQMAVHLPLSIEAQVEAHTLLMSTNNIFSPANGAPIISPSQDVVMGCYYMTMDVPDCKGEGMIFSSTREVHLAYALGKVDTHAKIKVKLPPTQRLKLECDRRSTLGPVIETTVGRVMFNDGLPPGMPFYNLPMRKSELVKLISDCYEILGRRATTDLLDNVNKMGFRENTRSGLSFATDDLITPPSKQRIIADAGKTVLKFQKLYKRGAVTDVERYNQVLDAWTHACEKIATGVMEELESAHRDPGHVNPIYLMARSGALGSIEQIRQLAGMCGLMAKPPDKFIEAPIKANFREGLSMLEYFMSASGARKRLADASLKAADSVCLTRKLADVAQNVVITMHDCGTTQGITKGAIYRGENVVMRLTDLIRGRVSRANIVNPITDETIVAENEMITLDIARRIEELGLKEIQVRSPMTCEASPGVCRCCYGMDLSTGALVEEGMAVGIIAAQSLGEPVSRFRTRALYVRGKANRYIDSKDIAVAADRQKDIRSADGALSRLTELFEARPPSVPAPIAEIDGRVELRSGDSGATRVVIISEGGIEVEYLVQKDCTLLVHSGDNAAAGDLLADGPPVPRDILRVSGEAAVRRYLLSEVQHIYRTQCIEIDDKHVEIIIAQMLNNVRIADPGDTDMLPGSVINKFAFQADIRKLANCVKITHPGDTAFSQGDIVSRDRSEDESLRVSAMGHWKAKWIPPKLAGARALLLGISQVASRSDSFVSAVLSKRVPEALIGAALEGRVEKLVGPKQSIITGQLIPVGTGYELYRDMKLCLQRRSHETLPAADVEVRLPEGAFGGPGLDAVRRNPDDSN